MPRRVRARLHRAVHGLPHEPRRALGRAPRRARLLARAARPRARREGVVLLPRRARGGGVAGAAARAGRRGRRAAPPDAPAAVPDLGLPAQPGGLQLGERALHLAGDAPAAAAAAARGARRAGDLGRPRAAGREARARAGRRRRRLRGLRLVDGERRERGRPARVPRHHAVLRGGQGRPRRGRGGGGEGAPRGARAEHRGRRRRRRDVPVGVVLPRPAGVLRGPDRSAAPVRRRRRR